MIRLYEKVKERNGCSLIGFVSLSQRSEYATLDKYTDIMLSNPVKIASLFQSLLDRDHKVHVTNPSDLNLKSQDVLFAEKYPLRILIAEDNPVNQIVLKKMLLKLGYSTGNMSLAENGKIAVAAVHRSLNLDGSNVDVAPFDVILMDVFMPEMDGLQATNSIRSDPRIASHRQPFIVALTANAMSKDAENCKMAGMDLYITKPVVMETLCHALIQASVSKLNVI